MTTTRRSLLERVELALYATGRRLLRMMANGSAAPKHSATDGEAPRPAAEEEAGGRDGQWVVLPPPAPCVRPLDSVAELLAWQPSPEQEFARTCNAPLLGPSGEEQGSGEEGPASSHRALRWVHGAAAAAAGAAAAAAAPPAAARGASCWAALRPGPQLNVCHDMAGGYLADRLTQGSAGSSAGYRIWHWHAIDSFTYFSHHLVTIPPPGWTIAAHRNGVPCLGTLIVEGRDDATAPLLASADVVDAVAERLACIAQYYGFDGWLLNFEAGLQDPGRQVPLVVRLVSQLRDRLRAALGPAAVVQWYDALTVEGVVDWQNTLNDKNRAFFEAAGAIFTNYWWCQDTPPQAAAAAADSGCAPSAVLLGTDVWGRRTFGGGGWDSYKGLLAAGAAGVSSALFAPGWVYESATPADQPQQFEPLNDRFWATVADAARRGVGWAPRPALAALPLVSTFNKGCSAHGYWVEGVQVGGGVPWYNMALQDLVPVCGSSSRGGSSGGDEDDKGGGSGGGSSYEVEVTEETAYSGGSCLRVRGVWAPHEAAAAASSSRLPLAHKLFRTAAALPEQGLIVSHAVAAQTGCAVHVALWLTSSTQPSLGERLLVVRAEPGPDPSAATECSPVVAAADDDDGNSFSASAVPAHLVPSDGASTTAAMAAPTATPAEASAHHPLAASASTLRPPSPVAAAMVAPSWTKTTLAVRTRHLVHVGYDTIAAVGLAFCPSSDRAPLPASDRNDAAGGNGTSTTAAAAFGSSSSGNGGGGGYGGGDDFSAYVGMVRVSCADDARNSPVAVADLTCRALPSDFSQPSNSSGETDSFRQPGGEHEASPTRATVALSCDLTWTAAPSAISTGTPSASVAILSQPFNRSYHVWCKLESGEGGSDGNKACSFRWLGECCVECYRVCELQLHEFLASRTASVLQDAQAQHAKTVVFVVQPVTACGVAQPLQLASHVAVVP